MGIRTPFFSGTPIPSQSLVFVPTVQREGTGPRSHFHSRPSCAQSGFAAFTQNFSSPPPPTPTSRSFLRGLCLRGSKPTIPGLLPVVTVARTAGQVLPPPSWKRAQGAGPASRGGASSGQAQGPSSARPVSLGAGDLHRGEALSCLGGVPDPRSSSPPHSLLTELHCSRRSTAAQSPCFSVGLRTSFWCIGLPHPQGTLSPFPSVSMAPPIA